MSEKRLPRIVESTEGVVGTLMLQVRATPDGERFELIVGGHYVMAASDGKSERLLAYDVLTSLGGREGITILVGGLGLGLTLREALTHRSVKEAWVAEIEETVVRWNRTYLKDYNGGAALDPRARIFIGDVGKLVSGKRSFFDAILMDVDNGPSFLVFERNRALYGDGGLKKMRRALKTGGVLGIWSYAKDPALEDGLVSVFGTFDRRLVRDEGIREDIPPTAIYTAVKARRSFFSFK